MTIRHTNRGLIASSLLLAASAALVGFFGGLRSAQRQDPKQEPVFNPAQQRVEMIQYLKSIDTRMASVERSLGSLERAASVGLQLMIKEQKVEQEPQETGPSQDSGNQPETSAPK
jgi:hypothetical protein